MRSLRLLIFLLALIPVASAFGIPEMLIVQSTAIKVKSEADTRDLKNARAVRQNVMESEPQARVPLDVTNALAEELYNDGRVSPIVWSMGDPIFRAAVTDGIIKSPPENPTLKQAQGFQQKLKVEYLLVVTADRVDNQLQGVIQLYRGNKIIWRDEKSFGVMNGARFNDIDTVKSVARTWTNLLGQGPLSYLKSSAVHKTPDPEPGLAPKAPDVQTPAVPKAAPNSKLFADVEALLKSGQVAQGISILRDAVDDAPADIERRKQLVSVLLRFNKPELAAKEARRASQVAPNDLDLRMMSAKGWLAAGKPEEAQADLNEIVARDPSGSGARELLGEAALWQLKAPAAIEHFDAAIKEAPTPEIFLYRALAKAIFGDAVGMASDLEAAKDLPTSNAEVRYSFCVLVIDKAVNQASDEIRPLFEAASAKPGKDVIEGTAYQAKRISSLIKILSQPAPPSNHEKSHERRLLALKLLSQALGDLGAYLEAPNDDTISDARINLGEALKQLSAANDVYQSEAKEAKPGERVG